MSKRKEAPASSPSYSRGAIVRIRLHNFMSYRDAEIADVGTKLNCIIGPNGTGKSSIVCAMCVGLGGSLGVTERGEKHLRGGVGIRIRVVTSRVERFESGEASSF